MKRSKRIASCLRKKLPASLFFDIDWDRVSAVVGTREEVTESGIRRECASCGELTYTSRKYPDDVAVTCDECAVDDAQQATKA